VSASYDYLLLTLKRAPAARPALARTLAGAAPGL
jgi:hypothetical protein